MCIYRCDTSPCVSIATSALKSAPSHAPPVGAGRGYRSRGLWARPRLRVARGALTGARLPPNGTTTIPRWSGRSSSSPGIGRICTSISSARSPGTRPCECSSIGASENGGCAPDPRRLNGARVIDARPVRSTGCCARWAWPSCPRLSRELIEARPASGHWKLSTTGGFRVRSCGCAYRERTFTGRVPSPQRAGEETQGAGVKIVPANSGSKSALGCVDRCSWAAEGGGDVPGILPELSRLGCGDFPALLLCVHLIDERVESAAGGTIIGRVRVGQERCDLAQGADEARLLLGRERAPDGLDQARAGVGRREDDEHASSLGARVEGGGSPGIDDYGRDEEVGQARVEIAPALPAIGALEDAAALGARVQGGGGLGVDRQSGDREIGQPRADRAPALPAVGALEDAAAKGACVEGGGLGVDRQGEDKEIGQPRIDGAPGRPAVGALEDAAVLGARVKGRRGLGVNGKGAEPGGGKARVAAAAAAVSALVKDAGGTAENRRDGA